MSGGAFDYLHKNTDLEDLWMKRKELWKVVGCLYIQDRKNGFDDEYKEAADEIASFYEALDSAVRPREGREPATGLKEWWEELRWLVKSVEWWQSGDTAAHHFRRDWKNYKEEGEYPKEDDE